MRKTRTDSTLTCAIWPDQAEQAVISLMLTNPRAVERATEVGLRPEFFFVESRRRIFSLVLERQRSGGAVDPVVICEMLDEETAAMMGGREKLYDYLDVAATFASFDEYAELIIRDYRRRLIAEYGMRVNADAYAEEDPGVLLSSCQTGLQALAGEVLGDEHIDAPLAEDISSEVERIDEWAQRGGRPVGIETGIVELDDIVSGFEPGQMVVLAARPGVGKTAMAINIALHVARREGEVYLLSLEMTRREVAQRLLALEAGVDLVRIRAAKVDPDELDRLHDALRRLSGVPLVVDDDAATTMPKLVSRLRSRYVQQRPAMVIIDYLQLMESGRRSESRQYEVASMSRQAKLLAREFNCPVVVVSQLSRQPRGEAPRAPRLSDLRDSGAIEQDADIVVFLHSPEHYTGQLKVIVAKNRQGPSGEAKVPFLPARMKFGTMAQTHEGGGGEDDEDEGQLEL
jgi:replicative DNA helicase